MVYEGELRYGVERLGYVHHFVVAVTGEHCGQKREGQSDWNKCRAKGQPGASKVKEGAIQSLLSNLTTFIGHLCKVNWDASATCGKGTLTIDRGFVVTGTVVIRKHHVGFDWRGCEGPDHQRLQSFVKRLSRCITLEV